MTLDVVCKMEIDEGVTELCIVFEGRNYCFCSEGCRAEFERHSADYLIVAESDAFRQADSENIREPNV